MSEIIEVSKPNENLIDVIRYVEHIQPLVFSWVTPFIIGLIGMLISVYILGKRSIMKDVILDMNLKSNLENIELSKKKLKKKMVYWSDTVAMIEWLALFFLLVTISYLGLFYINRQYVEFLTILLQSVYFVQGLMFFLMLLFVIFGYAMYKKNVIKRTFEEIDQEAQSIFEEILNKMGPKLTDSLINALIKKKHVDETKGFCKQEICKLKKKNLKKRATLSQNLLTEIAQFQWCPVCFSEIEQKTFLNEENHPKEKKLEAQDGLTIKEISEKIVGFEEQSAQTEEILCLNNCGRRYFKLCKEKGLIYKAEIDSVVVMENLYKQKKFEMNKEKNIIK